MAKKKSPTKQQIPIDWNQVDKFLAAGGKGTEIANYLGVHHDTLYDRCVQDHGMLFSEYTAKKRSKGDLMLKISQFNNAMSGSTPMQIWLGKQRLNQSDQPRSNEEFNGKLANLLDALHLINDQEEFEILVKKAKENKKPPIIEEGIKC